MTRLFISKATEAKAVATIMEMGGESLDPENHTKLSDALEQLCKTRSIENKSVGIELRLLSGHKNHDSDCSIYNAPAYLPTSCNCKIQLFDCAE
jgi:hypothetical protein